MESQPQNPEFSMESQPQNPEFRNTPENFLPCYYFYFSTKAYVVGTHWNCLIRDTSNETTTNVSFEKYYYFLKKSASYCKSCLNLVLP